MASKALLKKITIFSALVSLVSFLYNFGLGVSTASMVLIVASLSTLTLFISKCVFIKDLNENRATKRKAYLAMAFMSLGFAVLFLLFVVLKINGIDTSNKLTLDTWLGTTLLCVLMVMFVLSLIGLKGSLAKDDLMVLGLREVAMIVSLADFVIIYEFICRIVLKYFDLPGLEISLGYAPLAMSILMGIIVIFMFVRFFRYEVEKSKNNEQKKKLEFTL